MKHMICIICLLGVKNSLAQAKVFHLTVVTFFINITALVLRPTACIICLIKRVMALELLMLVSQETQFIFALLRVGVTVLCPHISVLKHMNHVGYKYTNISVI